MYMISTPPHPQAKLTRTEGSEIFAFLIIVALLAAIFLGVDIMRRDAKADQRKWANTPQLVVSERIVTKAYDIYRFTNSDTVLVVKTIPHLLGRDAKFTAIKCLSDPLSPGVPLIRLYYNGGDLGRQFHDGEYLMLLDRRDLLR